MAEPAIKLVGETAAPDAPVRLQRSVGQARVSFKDRNGQTCLDDMYQSGCAKIRLPRIEGRTPLQAVLLNTAGGLTDGDRYDVTAVWGPDTVATVTTQAAERVYRARQEDAELSSRLTLSSGATALWIPQETIMFDGGRLNRTTEIDLAEDSTMLACESTVFGRTAMGEVVRHGRLRDQWRIRRDSELTWLDTFEVRDDISTVLDRPAVAHGARAIATVLYVGPKVDAMLSQVRDLNPTGATRIGSSVVNSVCVTRLLANTGQALRRDLMTLLKTLQNRILQPTGTTNAVPLIELPRVWHC